MSFIKNTSWFRTLNNFDSIMIFGAKDAALQTYEAVRFLNFDINCYVVSEKGTNPLQLRGKPVKTFSEISMEEKRNCLVIISQNYENNERMEKILLHAGFKHIIPSVVQITLAETEKLNQYRVSMLGELKRADHISIENKLQEKHRKICIYAVNSTNNLHTATNFYQSKYVQYIQAGAVLTNCAICNLTDDTGDNISEKNPYYCELTVGYWIYKNDHQNSYVGLYHYSRGLSITDEQLESVVDSNIDIVLPVPAVLRHELCIRCPEKWIFVIFNALKLAAPEYLSDAEKYFYGKLFFQGNIVIARKKIYCQYYEWLFLILHKCEIIWNEIENTIPPPRWQGYIAEYLTGIYFTHHMYEYTVSYASMKSMI